MQVLASRRTGGFGEHRRLFDSSLGGGPPPSPPGARASRPRRAVPPRAVVPCGSCASTGDAAAACRSALTRRTDQHRLALRPESGRGAGVASVSPVVGCGHGAGGPPTAIERIGADLDHVAPGHEDLGDRAGERAGNSSTAAFAVSISTMVWLTPRCRRASRARTGSRPRWRPLAHVGQQGSWTSLIAAPLSTPSRGRRRRARGRGREVVLPDPATAGRACGSRRPAAPGPRASRSGLLGDAGGDLRSRAGNPASYDDQPPRYGGRTPRPWPRRGATSSAGRPPRGRRRRRTGRGLEARAHHRAVADDRRPTCRAGRAWNGETARRCRRRRRRRPCPSSAAWARRNTTGSSQAMAWRIITNASTGSTARSRAGPRCGRSRPRATRCGARPRRCRRRTGCGW